MKMMIPAIFFALIIGYFNNSTVDSKVLTHAHALKAYGADPQGSSDGGCGCGGKNKKKGVTAKDFS